jgi:hypothetical protein
VDPSDLSTTDVLELDNNEAALSVCLVTFASRPDLGALLAVGTAQGLQFYPRQVPFTIPRSLLICAAPRTILKPDKKGNKSLPMDI